MKKTVLFLMNGFGIEQLDSYNVFNSKLMPNLDSYTKKYLFSSIDTSAQDITSGYRLFSTGSDLPLTYALINENIEQFGNNPNMNFFLENVKRDSKIQLFLFIESDKSLEHLKEFIKFIRTKNGNNIFLHLVLTSIDINNYKEVEKVVNKVTYDYKDCRIASIVGLNTLKNTNLTIYMNMLKNEVGEKWIEVTKKFASLTSNKIAPINCKEFYINNGFNILKDDTFFFFNYSYTNLTNFIGELTKTFETNKYYSLFQIDGIKYPMYAYPVSGISMVNSLNKIDAKALVMTEQNNINLINYYCNGLKNDVSDKLFFTTINEIEDQEYIKTVIRNSIYDLIIIDYKVDDVNTIPELNKKLEKLDKILEYIHNFCTEEKITLFISSLYGMKKELPIDHFIKGFINFSSKVPFIVIDEKYDKVNFSLFAGNVYNLSQTAYTNINNKYEGEEVLLKRKSQIAKMLKK